MKKRNKMAERLDNWNFKLNTYEKSLVRLRELQRLRDLMLAKKEDELTPRQRSWIQKIWDFLWNNGIWGVWAPANWIAAAASAVTPDNWRMPRWGSTNATRPNPLLELFYPSAFWQGKYVEPDSWQINNSFNMDERLPTVSEVNNGSWANGKRIKSYPGVFGDADASVFAHMLFWPAAYWIFTTPALATDAIWTTYASIRNWYNAIADYYNKHKSKTWADKWVEEYLENTKKQIAEAEKYEKELADKYRDYIENYMPEGTWNSFDDIVKKEVDADTLYYISSKLNKRPDEISDAKAKEVADYSQSNIVPTKAALKTRDQIMLWLWRNPYAIQRSVTEPAKYLGD